MNNSIMLVREGDYAIVKIEVNGQWIELIKEYYDSPFSHVINPSGIKIAVEKQIFE